MPIALHEYEDTLDLPRALLQLESAYPDPPAPADTRPVEALRGGAVVLLVAAFERFLRAAVGEHLQRLTGDPAPIPFANLPIKLRVGSVFIGLNHAMSGPLHGDPGKREARLPDVITTAARVFRGEINVSALSETRGNADSEQVSEMLKSIAIEDPFKALRPVFEARWGRPEAERFIRDNLDSIVNRRHSVAHKAEALNLTRADLSEALRFMRTLAESIEDLVSGHVDSILGVPAPAP